MIVSLHVATGAAVGAVAGTRMRALLLGPPAHLLGDRVPHQDIASRRFEIASGIACVGLLAARRGPFDPATLGGLAASAPPPASLRDTHSSAHGSAAVACFLASSIVRTCPPPGSARAIQIAE